MSSPYQFTPPSTYYTFQRSSQIPPTFHPFQYVHPIAKPPPWPSPHLQPNFTSSPPLVSNFETPPYSSHPPPIPPSQYSTNPSIQFQLPQFKLPNYTPPQLHQAQAHPPSHPISPPYYPPPSQSSFFSTSSYQFAQNALSQISVPNLHVTLPSQQYQNSQNLHQTLQHPPQLHPSQPVVENFTAHEEYSPVIALAIEESSLPVSHPQTSTLTIPPTMHLGSSPSETLSPISNSLEVRFSALVPKNQSGSLMSLANNVLVEALSLPKIKKSDEAKVVLKMFDKVPELNLNSEPTIPNPLPCAAAPFVGDKEVHDESRRLEFDEFMCITANSDAGREELIDKADFDSAISVQDELNGPGENEEEEENEGEEEYGYEEIEVEEQLIEGIAVDVDEESYEYEIKFAIERLNLDAISIECAFLFLIESYTKVKFRDEAIGVRDCVFGLYPIIPKKSILTMPEFNGDVLSLSLGGSPRSSYSDNIAIAVIGAMQNGVSISSPVGNSRPWNSSVGNRANWITIVAELNNTRNQPAVVEDRLDLVVQSSWLPNSFVELLLYLDQEWNRGMPHFKEVDEHLSALTERSVVSGNDFSSLLIEMKKIKKLLNLNNEQRASTVQQWQLSFRRASNTEIMLSMVKIPLSDLLSSRILVMDFTKFSGTMVFCFAIQKDEQSCPTITFSAKKGFERSSISLNDGRTFWIKELGFVAYHTTILLFHDFGHEVEELDNKMVGVRWLAIRLFLRHVWDPGTQMRSRKYCGTNSFSARHIWNSGTLRARFFEGDRNVMKRREIGAKFIYDSEGAELSGSDLFKRLLIQFKSPRKS